VVPVPENLFKGRVGYKISEDGLAHCLNIVIGITTLHILVAPKRTVFSSKDRPKCKSFDLDALHFLGDIVGLKVNLLYLRRKLDVTVS